MSGHLFLGVSFDERLFIQLCTLHFIRVQTASLEVTKQTYVTCVGVNKCVNKNLIAIVFSR